jgi:predicted AlkP superfamily pyrophosphatase or phosphodiesterase
MKKLNQYILAVTWIALALFFSFGCKTAGKVPLARHVILIGIDGMGAQGFQLTGTPHLKQLAREGALSIQARSVMPTVSTPSWGSILSGAGPEQHGMTSNDWRLDNYTIEPTTKDEDGYFPSIFTLMRQNMPDAEMAVFYDWDGLGNIFNPKYLNRVELTKNYQETIESAIPYILEKNPQLVFLYLGYPDEVGHEHGFDSEEYYHSLEQVDAKVGELFEALKRAGLYEGTHILVVSDHGGIGTDHGGEKMVELEVPWIIRGPGVIKDRMIAQPVNIYDTAPTIAYVFHLEQPYEWIGRPVLGAFEANKALASRNVEKFIPKLKNSLKSGT